MQVYDNVGPFHVRHETSLFELVIISIGNSILSAECILTS